MNNIQKRLLEMSPYLHDTRLPLSKLSSLSKNSMETGFNLLGKIKDHNIDVYENKETGGILAGTMVDEEFFPIIRITCSERGLYIKSMQLQARRKHVKMLNVDKDTARQTFAISVYNFVASHFDLISDRIQYLGAKILWQSIARQGHVNIYVFDETKKAYVRDSSGQIVKYNGKNIDDNLIWGQKEEHQAKLLVASVRELK